MTLKYEIDTIDGLDETTAALYKKDEESGKYRLAIEGVPDVTGLRRKVDELLDERKADQRKAREEAERAAKAVGDIAALESSWQQRLNETVSAKESELNSLRGLVSTLTVGRAATELAAELAVEGASKALLPHIERRLKMEMVEGAPKIRVLDADGKVSAMTIDQLRDELKADPALARIVAGSKASGGGASGGNSGGGAPNKSFKDMTEAERVEFARRDPDGFRAARDSANKRR